MPAPLLLAYDGTCELCGRMMAWLQRRDCRGLLVFFPLQNSELVKMAPELAGRPLEREIHGLDLGTRQVWSGAALLPEIGRRLPRWRWIAPLFRLPGVASLSQKIYLRLAERRFRRCGRRPFER